MKLPDANYRCMNETCAFEWSGYRVLFHQCITVGPPYMVCPTPCPRKGKPSPKLKNYGMTECPECANIYVEWVNWEQCRIALGRYWER